MELGIIAINIFTIAIIASKIMTIGTNLRSANKNGLIVLACALILALFVVANESIMLTKSQEAVDQG